MLDQRQVRMHDILATIPRWESVSQFDIEKSEYRALLTALAIAIDGRKLEDLHVWVRSPWSNGDCEITLLTDRTWVFADFQAIEAWDVSVVRRSSIRKVFIGAGPFETEAGVDELNAKHFLLKFDGGSFVRTRHENNGSELAVGDFHGLLSKALEDLAVD